MLNCRDVSHLISQGQDRRLSWRERIGLRLHLWMCANCRRFERQMLLLRRALRRLAQSDDGPGLDAGARARIRRALESASNS